MRKLIGVTGFVALLIASALLITAVMGSAAAKPAPPKASVTAAINDASITCVTKPEYGLAVSAEGLAEEGTTLTYAYLFVAEIGDVAGEPYYPEGYTTSQDVSHWHGSTDYGSQPGKKKDAVSVDATSLDTTADSTFDDHHWNTVLWGASAAEAWWRAEYFVEGTSSAGGASNYAHDSDTVYVRCENGSMTAGPFHPTGSYWEDWNFSEEF